MKRVRIVVEGLTPLLTHRCDVEMLQQESRKRSHIQEDPKEEAKGFVYRTPDGYCGFPTIGFRNCMLTAAKSWRAPKGRASMVSVVGHVIPAPEIAPILDGEGEPYLDPPEIDVRPVIVNNSRIIRGRPRFWPWKCEFLFHYDEQLVTPDQLATILNDGGLRVGVGDYRVEKKGWFGQFWVIAVEPLKEEE